MNKIVLTDEAVHWLKVICDHIEILGVFHDKMEIEHYLKNW